MLIQATAVKTRQTVFIARKMRRHPIQDDGNACAVKSIDQHLEAVRLTVPIGRRKQTNRLIPPRTLERVFGDGQQLDMGKAHILHVSDQLVGEFEV